MDFKDARQFSCSHFNNIDNFESSRVSSKNKARYKNKPERIEAINEHKKKAYLNLGKNAGIDSVKGGLYDMACSMSMAFISEIRTYFKRNPKFKLQALKIILIKSGQRFKDEWKEYCEEFQEQQRNRVHAPAIADSGVQPWDGVSVEVAQLNESKVRCDPDPKTLTRSS